jgi:hypothetical protein
MEDEIKRRNLNDRMIFALSDAALGHRVLNSSYRTACNGGLLVAQNARRGRYYLAGEWLQNLRNSLREPRQLTDPFKTT